MRKITVINHAKSICDLFQNCLCDDLFQEGAKITIEVDRVSAEISVEREYLLPNGKTGRKYELHTYKMFSDDWKVATDGMNSLLKARDEFYDPDAQKQT